MIRHFEDQERLVLVPVKLNDDGRLEGTTPGAAPYGFTHLVRVAADASYLVVATFSTYFDPAEILDFSRDKAIDKGLPFEEDEKFYEPNRFKED